MRKQSELIGRQSQSKQASKKWMNANERTNEWMNEWHQWDCNRMNGIEIAHLSSFHLAFSFPFRSTPSSFVCLSDCAAASGTVSNAPDRADEQHCRAKEGRGRYRHRYRDTTHHYAHNETNETTSQHCSCVCVSFRIHSHFALISPLARTHEHAFCTLVRLSLRPASNVPVVRADCVFTIDCVQLWPNTHTHTHTHTYQTNVIVIWSHHTQLLLW